MCFYVNSKVGLSLSEILFQNPNNYSLGNFQKFKFQSVPYAAFEINIFLI